MDYFLLGVCSVAIIILLLGYGIYYRKNNKNVSKKLVKQTEKSDVKCPVCGMFLNKGENLVSKVFRPMNVPDQLMNISGCPHCYPSCEPGVKRICPVCHKHMSAKDVLTARLFNKTQGKKHVHIVGCSNCHKSKFD